MPDSSVRPQHPPRTPLSVLAEWLGAEVVGEATDVMVSGISLSSQRVEPGDLYAALPGSRAHGASYAPAAADAGAVAVLTDAAGAEMVGGSLPCLVVESPRRVLGNLAARVYDEPAAALTLMAVTGTQGKTTTTRLLESGLEAIEIPAAVIGTVGTRIDGEEIKTALTTPEAPDLQALFALMRERSVRACAMEVSSHALVMGRVDGVVFDVAAFLNLGRDHLDFHPTLQDYFEAKASLFTPRRARRGLTNIDDEHGRQLLEVADIPMVTFSASGAAADWRAVDVELAPTGSTFVVLTPGGQRIAASVPLTGGFNVDNALCAIALAGEAGLDPVEVARGIASGRGVPGRLERVEVGQDFLAVVDYAHKPDAVEAAIGALRPLTQGRVIVVIGAGGDRDTGKRPVMGEIASRLADVVIVTDDNPRSESPAAIRHAVLEGAHQAPPESRAEVLEVGDRRLAIRQAIALAQTGDVVLVAGKGHETGQEVADVMHPFDDRDEVRRAIGDRLEGG